MPVAGRPFLAHQLELLRAQGVSRVVLCVGHLGEQIEAAFGDGGASGVELIYSYDGPALAGTAGALRRALPLLGPEFLTLYGDSYLDVDYRAVWEAFQREGARALMTVIPHEMASEPANAWYESGRVRAYRKREPQPEMRHVDYGLGVFTAEILRDSGETADLADLQSRLAREGQLAGHEVTQRYFEIGSHQGLADLDSNLQGRA